MPSLWLIQDRDGHIGDEAVAWLSERLEVSEAKIREVISFYFMYRDEPQAKYVLQVCHNISCHIMGARPLLTHLEKQLGVRVGETTPTASSPSRARNAWAPAAWAPACRWASISTST